MSKTTHAAQTVTLRALAWERIQRCAFLLCTPEFRLDALAE